MSLMPDSMLTCRSRGTPAKAPSGTISSGFMGTWIASGTAYTGHPYCFEALRRIYFYDAWRQEPLLDAPDSDLVLPPEAGLLIQGCYWPSQQTSAEVLAVSDAETEEADHPTASLPAPEATDVTMAFGGS